MIVKIYNAIVLYGISFVAYNSYSSFKFKRGLQNSETKDGTISKIFAKMEHDKLYLDKKLTLREFASQLSTNQARMSDLLNNELGTTFNDFVNKYRVLEVQRVLKSKTASHLTLQAISENAGFKSKTTFYRAFKKITLQTPNKYLKELELKK
jgi:YesN/AraC family two-component response regulator